MIKKKIKIMIDKIYYNGVNEREELLKNLIKSLYEITLDDVNKLMHSAQYSEIPTTHEKINDIKNNCKKTYQLSK